MAFSHLGLQQYLERSDAIKIKREEEESQREALAFELAMKYGTFSDGSTLGTGKSGTSKTSSTMALKVLKSPKRYGLSDQALAPIVASGDKTALPRLLKIIEEQDLKYKNDNREMPKEEVNAIIESAVIDQGSTSAVDFDAIEEYIGRPLDDLYKKVIEQSASASGGVYYEKPGYIAKPDLTDLGPIIKSVALTQKEGARSEIILLNKELGKFLNADGNPREGLTDEEKNQASLLTKRLGRVENALENFEDDPLGLVGLYGNSYAIKLFNNYPEYDGLLPESLTDPTRQYMSVASPEMAIALLMAGIIEEGTIVRLPDGRELPVRNRR